MTMMNQILSLTDLQKSDSKVEKDVDENRSLIVEKQDILSEMENAI